jgi:hypothetical protein
MRLSRSTENDENQAQERKGCVWLGFHHGPRPSSGRDHNVNFNYQFGSHLNITTWPMALALLGLELLVAGWWLGCRPARAVESLAIGEGAG